MLPEADITIIGAGVVGLAIASQVARPGRAVYILEKNARFGLEQSSRNSQTVHAGMLYDDDSLKTCLCIEGNRWLYELCDRNGIGCIKCGKLCIAMNAEEVATLQALYEKGRRQGVDLKMLSQQEIKRIEPNMKTRAAFHSPNTGIIDTYALMGYFLAKSRENGAQIACKAEVIGIEKLSAGYRVSVEEPAGYASFTTVVLINCAGLYSDRIAGMAGIDVAEANYKLCWIKGEYYSVFGGKSRFINGLIYPLPLPLVIDMHVCLDLDWRLRLGPYFYPVDEVNYEVDDSHRDIFLKSSIMKALPFIEAADIEPESSGIIGMLPGEGDRHHDFVIKHERERGLPGLINLIGMESPALTASPAIARYVSEMVDQIL